MVPVYWAIQEGFLQKGSYSMFLKQLAHDLMENVAAVREALTVEGLEQLHTLQKGLHSRRPTRIEPCRLQAS